MSFKVFLLLIILGTIVAWISWGMVIFYFDPWQVGFLEFSLFYSSLFLGLSGIIFLFSNWLRGKIFKKQLLFPRLKTAVRQAILFAALIVGWAFLKANDLLTWWILILFILILTALEFFFVSSQKKKMILNDEP